MFPTFAFRQAWECLDRGLDGRKACQEYVKILYEAARLGREERVNIYLEECLCKGVLPESSQVKALFKDHNIEYPELKSVQCELADYEVLLGNAQGGDL